MASASENKAGRDIFADEATAPVGRDIFADEPLPAAEPEITLKGILGVGKQAAAGMFVEPAAGLAGLVKSVLWDEGRNLQDRLNEGGRVARYIQENRMPDMDQETIDTFLKIAPYIPEIGVPLGNAVFEATGDAELATFAHTLPTAIMELSALRIPGIIGKVALRQARLTHKEANILAKEIEALKEATAAGQATEEGVQAIADYMAGSKPDAEELAQIAQFDQRVLDAAREEGLSDIPPSVAAGNAQFRDLAQGLASLHTSPAKAQYGAFMERLANRADEVIEAGGGSVDKQAVSAKYKDHVTDMIEEMSLAESLLYRQIDQMIKPEQRIEVGDLRAFVDQEIERSGGVKRMPSVMKKLYELVYERGPDGEMVPYSPTYGFFTQTRREVGAAVNKKQGPFRHEESGTLKYAYGPLKGTQERIAKENGFDVLQRGADAWTIKRKALEKSVTNMLGREMVKDLMPEVASRITGLPKGNVTRFERMVNDIPTALRQEVVVSALNDILRGIGADQKGMGAARFVGLMNEFNRSPTAKQALYKHLPAQTQKSMENLYTLANGVYKANQQIITTGKIRQFFPDTRSFLRRTMEGAALSASARVGGVTGAQATAEIIEFLQNQTPRAKSANELLASKEFQVLMQHAVRDGVLDGFEISNRTKKFERAFKRSKAYRNWANNLTGSAKADLISLGLVNFLMVEPLEQEQEQE